MGRARLLEGGRGAENASVDGAEGLVEGYRADLRLATSRLAGLPRALARRRTALRGRWSVRFG